MMFLWSLQGYSLGFPLSPSTPLLFYLEGSVYKIYHNSVVALLIIVAITLYMNIVVYGAVRLMYSLMYILMTVIQWGDIGFFFAI